jgi:Cu(I)/Ag(I) efflux system protein CusF
MNFTQRMSALAMALCATLTLAPHVQAHEGHDHASTDTQGWTMAEVKKVDTAQKKITLKHGDIGNLNMPGMTMVFNVKNAQLLQGVQAGDHVQFTATQEGDRYFVTQLKPAH